MKSTYNIICKAMLLFMCIFFLSGCSSPKLENQDNKVASDDQRVLTIGDNDVTIDEVMLYLLRAKKEFERVGGEDVWDHDDFSGGKKAEQVAKLVVLNSITKRKIYAAKSNEIGISLTDVETNESREQGINYYEGLEQAEIDQYKLTQEVIVKAFVESALGNKVETVMLNDYVPEVEEIDQLLMVNEAYKRLRDVDTKLFLRKMKILQITFKTHEKNDKDDYVSLSNSVIEEAKNNVEEAHRSVMDGEDFTTLRNRYSGDNTQYTGEQLVPISNLPEAFKSLEGLEVGDISPILQDEAGYHIFKVIGYVEPTEQEIKDYTERFNQWVDVLREEAIKEIKMNVINDTYADWKNNTDINLKEGLWEKIDVFGNINKNAN